ncbi:uncharacterized protein N7515_005876 [Penicillium bovifimosum]|uniref:Uncharacterized protein n=1 Tax=Penicillium bovifimosum TaxID=126998 RepID=A0A9W9GTP5_9EURO|nr:uncharacterized protein N7515_005876 [Penicillium bovifimosum]KAJ5129837.1 hypothetical protein N7515_005876 [Penicillium bovifimosum]
MAPIPGSDNALLSREERDSEADAETGLIVVGLIYVSLVAVLALAVGCLCFIRFIKCVRSKLKARRRDGREKYEGSPLKVIEGKEPARPKPAHVAGHGKKQAEVDLTPDYMRKSTALTGSR